MSGAVGPGCGGLSPEEARLQPLYARVIGLRHVHPGPVLCFVFFEGAIGLAVLLALAELVTWWAVLILPATVAVMVKVNDLVAGAVTRSAARVPEREQERFRREVTPVVGRASVSVPITGAPVTEPEAPPPTAAEPGDAAAPGAPASALVRPPTPPVAPGPDHLGPATGSPQIPPQAAGSDHDVGAGPRAAERPDGAEGVTGPASASGGQPGTARAEHLHRPVRPRTDLTDRINPADTPEQRSRQSATRRYD